MKTKFLAAATGCLMTATVVTAQPWRQGGDNITSSSLTQTRIGNLNPITSTLPNDLQVMAGGNVQMHFLANGQIGVGVFLPGSPYKMDIAGSINLSSGIGGAVRPIWVDGREALFYDPASDIFSWGYGGTFNFFGDAIRIGFGTGPAPAPPISGFIVEGHTGIGTAAPASILHVTDAVDPAFIFGASGIGANAVLGIASGVSSYSQNAQPGDVVFGPKGGASRDLILSVQNFNQGSIRFKTGTTGLDVERMTIRHDGNVGIGVSNPQNKLEVCGLVRAKEVIVETMWCDFVFEKSYRLRPLSEVEAFIAANKHLPEIPSAKDVETNGVKIGEVHARLLQKVEELTLYMIEADKQIKALQAENEKIKTELETVKNDSGK
ncbi:MAG: hypothetical protein FD123_2511 [Bacteroidetes bacterium]|nr:MAG: hypothetical protein FD123_2511 [Bacteroidota bacterium]